MHDHHHGNPEGNAAHRLAAYLATIATPICRNQTPPGVDLYVRASQERHTIRYSCPLESLTVALDQPIPPIMDALYPHLRRGRAWADQPGRLRGVIVDAVALFAHGSPLRTSPDSAAYPIEEETDEQRHP